MNQQGATAFRPPWWARLHPNRWEGYLYRALSDHTVGGESVPLSWASAKFQGDKITPTTIIAFTNDAFEVALGYEDAERWNLLLRRPMWHRLIRWYLWQWAAHEWCGLRRWAWYRLLHRRCARQRRQIVALRREA